MTEKPIQSVEPVGVPDENYYKWSPNNTDYYIIQNDNKDRICEVISIYCGQRQAETNRNVICTAVNNTYGKGINPESVPDLHHALDEIRTYLNCGYKIEDFCWENINNALTKSELK